MKVEERKTQKQLFAEELKQLNLDLTKEDRVACLTDVGISPSSLSNYLNGKGSSNDTAATLIKFFKGRIAERNKVLEDA